MFLFFLFKKRIHCKFNKVYMFLFFILIFSQFFHITRQTGQLEKFLFLPLKLIFDAIAKQLTEKQQNSRWNGLTFPLPLVWINSKHHQLQY